MEKKITQFSRKVGSYLYTSKRWKYNLARWDKAMAQKRRMPQYQAYDFVPTATVRNRILKAETAYLLTMRKGKVVPELVQSEFADPRGSLGFASHEVGVKVSGPGFFESVIAFPIRQHQKRPLVRGSVTVFRWNEDEETYERMATCGQGDGFAWARITTPGRYVAIGMPADPVLQTLIQVTSAMAPTIQGLDKEARHNLLSDVVKALGNRQYFDGVSGAVIEQMFMDGWQAEPLFFFGGGFGGDFEGGGLPNGGPFGGLPFGWEPGDDICPPMPRKGWPEWGIPGFELPRWPLIPGWSGGIGGTIGLDFGWQSKGPRNIPGHSTEVVIDPSSPNRIYTSTANGGVWVLEDVTRYPGLRWRPLTDQTENLNLQCMAVAASDGRVIYYADGASRVHFSTDQGLTWNRTSDRLFGLANRILVHPTDPTLLYLAAEDGLHRSTNSGANWVQIYTGAVTDAVMDHENSDIIYIGVRTVGLVKTRNASEAPASVTWTTVHPWSATTSPGGTEIRIGLSRTRTAATRAVVVRFDQEVFLNKNGGVATTGANGWSSKGKVGGAGYSWWCFAVGISPFNDNILLAGSEDLFRTTNGGDTTPTWTQVAGYGTDPHPDQWDVTFDPSNSGVVYLANDGGVYRSTNNGSTWTYLSEGLVTGQLYKTGISGTNAVSGMYHQGIVATTTVQNGQWTGIEGGSWEFARIVADPKRPSYHYVFNGNLHRRRWPNVGTGDLNIDWCPFPVSAIGVDRRFLSNTIFVGIGNAALLKRALDGGNANPTWTDESISLNTNERVTAIEFASATSGRVYVGTNQGRVFEKAAAGGSGAWVLNGTWGNAIIALAVDPGDPARLYAISSRDVATSPDGGATWTSVRGTGTGRLPDDDNVALLVHPAISGAIFVAQNSGVYLSVTSGGNWTNYDNAENPTRALPNAPIQSMVWHQGNLWVATHGRGLFKRFPVI